MDMGITGANNALPEQDSPKKLSRLPPLVRSSTTNFIRLQSNLKEHDKGEYAFYIITKETADYSAIKSYLEKIISTISHSPQIPKSL
jgi:hypothetical protein